MLDIVLFECDKFQPHAPDLYYVLDSSLYLLDLEITHVIVIIGLSSKKKPKHDSVYNLTFL